MEYTLMEKFIIACFNGIISLISLFPSLPPDSALNRIPESIAFIIELISKTAIFVPLGDIMVAFGLVMSYRAVMLIIFITNWIIRRIADIIP